ncbi:MAG: crossover junction endodeoxyribonuclease RuvC [Candidatus Thermochlorobacter aerophilum]|uniref:Crossover junction endodeoxyribonuclease RuvC n=1 Tax=Candidatus Thermochlorobacter aerophilus TaxID=1868324 RepID=A0A395M2H8_9BACT|nr:MAG: crossover junction endodeoxyribonuclease RuvC [Candidatus Thermochlorobacter aerophilum]
MRILGVDPGSLTTGYGVIEAEQEKLSALTFGTVHTDAQCAFASRLKKIYDELHTLIERYRPERLSLETAFHGKNAQSALKLGQVRGAVMVLALNFGLEIAEYSPREVKQALTGKGNAAKEQVAFMVKKLLQLSDTVKFLDATDALGLALCDAFKHSCANLPTILHSSRIPTRQHQRSSWKKFIDAHPHLVIRS